MATENIENYLKNIYKIQTASGKVTTTSLSHRLHISPASVTEMLKKLKEEGCVTYTPYKGVELTSDGRRRALRIVRRHRLWELFLVEVLKYDWHEIDEEAERLEHSMSDRLEHRIDEILGYPRRDPHGDVIPTHQGTIETPDDASLANAPPGASVVVSRVRDDQPEILKYAARLGILLGRRIRIKERIDFDGSLRAEVAGRERFISAKLADNIFVVPSH